jgi:hypothetical protein
VIHLYPLFNDGRPISYISCVLLRTEGYFLPFEGLEELLAGVLIFIQYLRVLSEQLPGGLEEPRR